MSPTPILRPKPIAPDDDKFVPLAAELGARFAPNAAKVDRENVFVHENYKALKEKGYLRMPLPESLGGLGASMRQVCFAQAELGKHCGSTALAANMHLYNALLLHYLYQRGEKSLEGPLNRVGREDWVLMTSGGSDWIWPNAVATRVEGGYRITARKAFCSQAPGADLLTTTAVIDEPGRGRVTLNIGVPMKNEGIQIIETWDTLGMRGTASHDVQITDVFVSESAVSARREWGKIDAALRASVIHISPTVGAVYYGVAAGARDEAVKTILSRKLGNGAPMAEDVSVQRLVGEMDAKLRTSWWSLLGSVDELGDNFEPSEANFNTVLLARRYVIESACEVVDIAMEAVGGSSYYKKSSLERAYRDVRAGKYHPLTPEKALFYAGRLTLGLPVDVA